MKQSAIYSGSLILNFQNVEISQSLQTAILLHRNNENVFMSSPKRIKATKNAFLPITRSFWTVRPNNTSHSLTGQKE